MANNYALKELKYKHTNGTVEDVKGLNIDGYQWRKPYDLTVSSIPEGVGTVTIQRTETESNCNQLPQPTPSTPVKMVYSEPITVEDIVLHGDKLSVSATPADEGYNSPEVSFESGVAFGQVVNNVNVTVQSGGGKTFYVQYNQGNADNGNNLPTENPQPRVYPNGVSVRSNLLPKATQSDPSYTVTYTRDDLAHSGPTSDWAQTSYDVTTYQPDGWTTNAAEYNNCEYASGDIIGKDVIGTINLYPNFDVTTTNSGVVVSDYVFERNSNETTSGGNTLTVKYNQGFATSGTIPAIQTATGGATINTTSYFQDG